MMRSELLPARLLICLLLATILAGAGCDLPRDPEGTLERVRQTRRVRVGVVENSPWVVRAGDAANDEPTGVEAELVRELASELGAVPEWSWGGEGRHMEALKHFQLDLVVGGITRGTAYRHEVALTAPYFTDRLAVGVSPSAPKPENIENVRVAAQRGAPAAGHLGAEGAQPVLFENLSLAPPNIPVAASHWQLEALGYQVTDLELHKDERVFAAPPGENKWLFRLSEFTRRQQTRANTMLREGARP